MNTERRLVVLILGLLGLVALGGALYLFATGKEVPGGTLLAVTTTVVGILSPSPLSKSAVPPS